ncbi:DUF4440 domain-containing protein [Flavobacterium sp. IMCC34852]|uniref:DUF4440 domain-containing protein n=1 Tax=Flavobacterium rivulicola TaxID=2732161 RepID=A0A7Y3R9F2_9FLAO|nr:DUF4440 domain-containing protein [Flavobacterium sp. IMCC34852]NNT72365.1 DUF4440 domain-containing protein [Flavobacterium sp. IMCC34852]
MKKINTIILGLCFTALSFGQNAIKTEESQLKELIIKSFDEIWSELNSKNIDKYYTKDFLLLENGEVWNNDTIAKYLDKAVLKKPKPTRVNSIEIIDVKVSNGTAWIAYKNHAVFTVDNKIIRKAYWLESATAILTENSWKLDMLHSTRVKNE